MLGVHGTSYLFFFEFGYIHIGLVYISFNVKLNKYFISEEFLVRKLKYRNFETIELNRLIHLLLENFLPL